MKYSYFEHLQPRFSKELIQRFLNLSLQKQLLNYLSFTQSLILKTLKETEISEADKIKSFAQLLAHELTTGNTH